MTETQQSYQKREDVPEQYCWNLEDIYISEEAWEKDFQAVSKLLNELKHYRGQVLKSAENLYQTLVLKDEILMLLEKVTTYAMLHRDENTGNQHFQGLADRVTALSVQVESRLSFIMPEIISLELAKLQSYIESKDELELYRHFLDDALRQKQHFLSPEEEEIVAQAGEIAQAPRTIFSLLTNADMEFPQIDVAGEKKQLTQGNFVGFLQSTNRETRRAAYDALFQTYTGYANTLGATYGSSIKGDMFQARVRRYNSALEAALDPDKIPLSLYDNLLSSIHDHLPALHRYMELKKKVLGLNELKPYDLYVPVTGDSKRKPSVEEAQSTVIQGLSVMGEEYIERLKKGFKERWLDVYETKGKRSGAYSWGAYGVHPFVLLNYQHNLENVFTIAHEMGHALHSYYTNENQPYVYSHYPIFLAEVASTVNEALLFKHLLNNAEAEEKASLLEKNLEQFRATVFRQVLFAEFEKKVHELAEAGTPVTPDKLNEIYGHLLEKYYGSALVVDDYIRGEWARIPHFYSAFYVYKYATGFSSAVALSEKLAQKDQTAKGHYLQFLRSGACDYPLEILKKAGVDLSTGKPVDEALAVFEQRLEEFETLLEKQID
ncbi:oligoendopeptidase F [Metallumcola ferriviriculae]|uniref:Oligopeptidase F n=1 Tax=Metallumcola ferriviriculae TaxID=3039180 RepID=A0AAU0UQM8_9FIRM|nr:oligoendopeptidase F [Desulfitibacteraceae bacterium MK1]